LDGIGNQVARDIVGYTAHYIARRLTDGIPENGGIHFRESWLREIGRIAADASRNHSTCRCEDYGFALT
jgi:hypothetical protein